MADIPGELGRGPLLADRIQELKSEFGEKLFDTYVRIFTEEPTFKLLAKCHSCGGRRVKDHNHGPPPTTTTFILLCSLLAVFLCHWDSMHVCSDFCLHLYLYLTNY